MPDIAENKTFTIDSALSFFESRIKGMTGSTRDAYRKAFLSFRIFAASCSAGSDPLSLSFLEDWYVGMRFHGLTAKTSLFYLESVASMYNAAVKQGEAPCSDIFKTLKAKVKSLGSCKAPFIMTEAHCHHLRDMFRSEFAGPSVIGDMILFSILNGCMPLGEMALLRKEDVGALDLQSQEIAQRNIDARRKFVFHLGQTMSTPRQLEARVSAEVTGWLRTAGFPVEGSAIDSLRSIWGYIALGCGVTANDIVDALGCVPAGMPALTVCSGGTGGAERKDVISAMVAEALAMEPLRWFAMRLRPRVGYEDVVGRLVDNADAVKRPEMFYPCEEIARRIGKKLVWREKPFISDVVFFKSRRRDIYRMFTVISDLAWVYKTDRNRFGDYAVIPDSAMRRFQAAIGKFSPGYEVAPVGQLELRPDDKVVVIGGDYVGQTGRFIETDTQAGDGNVVYRILLLGASGKWNVGIDARLVKPA